MRTDTSSWYPCDGNLACWENDPVSVIPGTTGDYKYINAPESQQPVLNVVHFPGDAPYMPSMDTTPDMGDGTQAPTAPDGTAVPAPVQDSPIVLFVKNNKEVSLVIGVIMLSIIVINIILIVRIHRLKNAGKRHAKKHSGGSSDLF